MFKSMTFQSKIMAAAFLFVSVLIGYVPYWAPYYFDALGQSKVNVIGTLKEFEQACPSGSECITRYLIPKKLFSTEEKSVSIGLGEIIGGVSYGCHENGQFKPIFENESYPGSTTLHVYRTIPLELFKTCTDTIEIQASSLQSDVGKGYYEGALFFGYAPRIESIKRFIEFFLLVLPQMLGLAGLAFFLVVTSLSGLLSINPGRRNFFNLIPFWFLTFLFTSGFVATLLPVENSIRFFPRVGAYFSNLSFFLTGVNFAQRQNASTAVSRVLVKLTQPFTKSSLGFFQTVLSPISIILIIGMSTPVFASAFGFLSLLMIVMYLFIGYRNFEFLCLTIAYILSVLKIFNVSWAPAGNTVFFFIAFYFVYETYVIVKLELHTYLMHLMRKSAHASASAQQMVHDIKSPIAALKMILTQSDWSHPSLESREVVLSAINKVSAISKSALDGSKSKAEFVTVDIKRICEEICNEIVSFRERKLRITIRNLTDDQTHKIRFSQIEFYRVMGNLIANASQANNVSYVNIKLAFKPSREVVISVENDGDSIPSDILSEIMANGGTYNKKDGTGLGLVYCRETIAKFGGEFYLSSMNEETIATVTLRSAY